MTPYEVIRRNLERAHPPYEVAEGGSSDRDQWAYQVFRSDARADNLL